MAKYASGPAMPEKCNDCPFREDGQAIILRPIRLRGIQLCTILSQPFYCHKTTKFSQTGERSKWLECAGALEYRERIWKEKGPEASLEALQELLALPLPEVET